MRRLLDEDEELNPMLSVTNLVDVFLVIIAALLIAIAQNPLNPLVSDNVTVIKNAGKENMEVIIKKGEKSNITNQVEQLEKDKECERAWLIKWKMVR